MLQDADLWCLSPGIAPWLVRLAIRRFNNLRQPVHFTFQLVELFRDRPSPPSGCRNDRRVIHDQLPEELGQAICSLPPADPIESLILVLRNADANDTAAFDKAQWDLSSGIRATSAFILGEVVLAALWK